MKKKPKSNQLSIAVSISLYLKQKVGGYKRISHTHCQGFKVFQKLKINPKSQPVNVNNIKLKQKYHSIHTIVIKYTGKQKLKCENMKYLLHTGSMSGIEELRCNSNYCGSMKF